MSRHNTQRCMADAINSSQGEIAAFLTKTKLTSGFCPFFSSCKWLKGAEQNQKGMDGPRHFCHPTFQVFLSPTTLPRLLSIKQTFRPFLFLLWSSGHSVCHPNFSASYCFHAFSSRSLSISQFLPYSADQICRAWGQELASREFGSVISWHNFEVP